MRRIPVALIAIGLLVASMPPPASAQMPAPERLLASASVVTGRVHGHVRDGSGVAVVGASVIALGATVIASRTDTRGRFQMTVPPGDYILRATRDGYVSTYREPVRIGSRGSLERTITLHKQELTADGDLADSHAHTELAWRLRHLPRSVLRDGVATLPAGEDPTEPERVRGSLFYRALETSQRFASWVAETDFTGQVNFVTTALADPALPATTALPRSVAYVVVGAPVGSRGDWRVRGAVASGSTASWNFLGEYEARKSRSHRFKLGVSYSSLGARLPAASVLHGASLDASGRLPRYVLESRSVAGVFAGDRWRVVPGIDVDYVVRADRYDFLTEPYLFSGSGSLRARVLPSTYFTAAASRSMTAPGAEEFLPPPAKGPWLPAERTFAPLSRRDGLRAEAVRHVEAGLARDFGSSDRRRSIHVRAFSQSSTDQIATLFGVSDAGHGHYFVGHAGTVAVTGWAIGLGGRLFGVLGGQIEYARLDADWTGLGRTRSLRRLAPSAVRDRLESFGDLTASLEANMNEDRTRIAVMIRTSSGFSQADRVGRDTRFDFQVHQALPYRLSRHSQLELLFAARTLFRDPASGASRFDELLTVAPPLRLMGGIQVRF